MDIPRPDLVRERRRRRIIFAVSAIVLVVMVSAAVSRLKPAVPKVERASVWIDTVKRGPMSREVHGSGSLVPEEIRWITVMSPGRIERIPLLPGVAVHTDTVLLELSNPDLEQAAFETESQVKTAEVQLEKLIAELEKERITQEVALESLRGELNQTKLEAEADEKLLADGLVPDLNAKRSRARADDLGSKVVLEEKRLKINAKCAAAQLTVQQAELDKFRKQDALKAKQLQALKVRAACEGVLQRLGDERQLQVGQQLGAGAVVARVANATRLKAEIKIAETQARDVQLGQAATIDTRNGIIPGHVVRVDPAVQNGTVTVDVALDGPLPKGARPDLSVEGTITLQHLADVLFVGRPVTGQAEAKASVFKLTDAGRGAVRVRVSFGCSSVNTIEIREGLSVGDQIILSDMSQWDGRDRIKVN